MHRDREEGLQAVKEVQERLFSLRDEGYKTFHAGLIPTVDPARIIGVRVPLLRKYAREIAERSPQTAQAFLSVLPHTYYEENVLHGLLIGREKTFSAAKARLDVFVSYMDNWAVTDVTAPKALQKEPAALQAMILEYLERKEEYAVRFGIVSAMRFYKALPDPSVVSDAIAGLKREEYYIKMAAAWYFATAYALDKQRTLPYFLRGVGDAFTQNKAIQKARESLRVPGEEKAFLSTLRAKKD